ncbi:hypothetical protein [Acinetobacter bereziniae]|uniref:hypothetical protein n=1 Tax=Acinetobacter bereziniae TaxID=106648 RepID=UPI00148F3835|nr:hypothetical protein [Acinetobacter bereziniae]
MSRRQENMAVQRVDRLKNDLAKVKSEIKDLEDRLDQKRNEAKDIDTQIDFEMARDSY